MEAAQAQVAVGPTNSAGEKRKMGYGNSQEGQQHGAGQSIESDVGGFHALKVNCQKRLRWRSNL
jgi:hypothetical protein